MSCLLLWCCIRHNQIFSLAAQAGFTGIGFGAAYQGLRHVVELITFNFSMQLLPARWCITWKGSKPEDRGDVLICIYYTLVVEPPLCSRCEYIVGMHEMGWVLPWHWLVYRFLVDCTSLGLSCMHCYLSWSYLFVVQVWMLKKQARSCQIFDRLSNLFIERKSCWYL